MIPAEAATTNTAAATVHLEVRGLAKHFPVHRGLLRRAQPPVRAVEDVSFQVHRGETLGLVGESGSGKSTLGKCILRVLRPTRGQILLRLPDETVVDLAGLDGRDLHAVRPHLNMVFQDPYASLNPRMTVLDIIAEPLICQRRMGRGGIRRRARELMDMVGLDVRHLARYPHAFSGGQRQRIGIARALAANPGLIVCDEAVSALDVSVQAQVLNLLADLQERLGLTYIFIAHDLAVVKHLADRIAVMYVGKLMELAPNATLFRRPRHPYTEALLSAAPTTEPEGRPEPIMLRGEIANPADPPAGCRFHPRCPYAQKRCAHEAPAWRAVGPDHHSACHFAEELDLRGTTA